MCEKCEFIEVKAFTDHIEKESEKWISFKAEMTGPYLFNKFTVYSREELHRTLNMMVTKNQERA